MLGQLFAGFMWESSSPQDDKSDECIRDLKRQRPRGADSDGSMPCQLLGNAMPARSPCQERRGVHINNKNHMTKEDFAKKLIPTMRSWSETVFKTALIGRSEADVENIINEFYDSYQNEISFNPDGHAMDYVHIIMDIEKT